MILLDRICINYIIFCVKNIEISSIFCVKNMEISSIRNITDTKFQWRAWRHAHI